MTELLAHKETEYFKKRKKLNDDYKHNKLSQRMQKNRLEILNDILPIQNEMFNISSEDTIEELFNFKSQLSNDHQKELWDKLNNHISSNVNQKSIGSKRRKYKTITHDEEYFPKLIGVSTIIKNSSLIKNIDNKSQSSFYAFESCAYPTLRERRFILNKEKENVSEIRKATEIMAKYKSNNRLIKVLSSHNQELNDLKQKCFNLQTEHQEMINSIKPIDILEDHQIRKLLYSIRFSNLV